jgi:hypothetical protein
MTASLMVARALELDPDLAGAAWSYAAEATSGAASAKVVADPVSA